MTDIVKKTQKRIEQLLHDKEEEIKELQQRIEDLNEKLSAHNNEMEQAVLACDIETYKAVKAKRDEAQIELTVYIKKLQALKEKSLVTKEENEQVIESLIAQHKKLSENARKQTKALVSQIDKIRQAFLADQIEINNTIREWHDNIYQQTKVIGKRGNEPIVVENNLQQYDGGFLNYAKVVCDDGFIKKLIEQQKE